MVIKMDDKTGFDLSKLEKSIEGKEYNGPIIPTYDWDILPPDIVYPIIIKYCEQVLRLARQRKKE